MATYGASPYPNAITVVDTVIFSGYAINGTYSTSSLADAITILTYFLVNPGAGAIFNKQTFTNSNALLSYLNNITTSTISTNTMGNAFVEIANCYSSYYPTGSGGGVYWYFGGACAVYWAPSQLLAIETFLGSFYVNYLNGVVAAQNAANNAQGTANTALTNANNAQGTANTALTNANNAQGTANTALTNANNAQGTANTANSTANTLQSLLQTATRTTNTTDAQSVLKAGIQSTSSMLQTLSTMTLYSGGYGNTYAETFHLQYTLDAGNKLRITQISNPSSYCTNSNVGNSFNMTPLLSEMYVVFYSGRLLQSFPSSPKYDNTYKQDLGLVNFGNNYQFYTAFNYSNIVPGYSTSNGLNTSISSNPIMLMGDYYLLSMIIQSRIMIAELYDSGTFSSGEPNITGDLQCLMYSEALNQFQPLITSMWDSAISTPVGIYSILRTQYIFMWTLANSFQIMQSTNIAKGGLITALNNVNSNGQTVTMPFPNTGAIGVANPISLTTYTDGSAASVAYVTGTAYTSDFNTAMTLLSTSMDKVNTLMNHLDDVNITAAALLADISDLKSKFSTLISYFGTGGSLAQLVTNGSINNPAHNVGVVSAFTSGLQSFQISFLDPLMQSLNGITNAQNTASAAQSTANNAQATLASLISSIPTSTYNTLNGYLTTLNTTLTALNTALLVPSNTLSVLNTAAVAAQSAITAVTGYGNITTLLTNGTVFIAELKNINATLVEPIIASYNATSAAQTTATAAQNTANSAQAQLTALDNLLQQATSSTTDAGVKASISGALANIDSIKNTLLTLATESSVTTANNDISTLQTQLSTLQASLNTLSNNAALSSTVSSQISSINTNIASLQNTLTTSINAAQTTANQAEKDAQAGITNAATAQSATNSAQAQLTALDNLLQQATSSTTDAGVKAAISGALVNIDSIKNTLVTLATASSVTTANNNISTLQTQLSTLQASLNTLSNNAALSSTVSSQISSINTNITSLQNTLTTSINAAQTTANQAEKDAQTSIAQESQLQSSVNTLKTASDLAAQNVTTLQGQVSSLQNQANYLTWMAIGGIALGVIGSGIGLFAFLKSPAQASVKMTAKSGKGN